MALSFDDGPRPPYTAELLAILRSRDARATFFATGANLEQYPDEARAIVAGGHELANHSYAHTRMIFESYAFVRSEIERTDALIRRAGQHGEILFRAPYQKKLFLLPLYLQRTDRTQVSADVEPDAFAGPEDAPDTIVQRALANVRSGSIIGVHAESRLRTSTLKAVPLLLDALAARGYRVVTVSELLAHPAP